MIVVGLAAFGSSAAPAAAEGGPDSSSEMAAVRAAIAPTAQAMSHSRAKKRCAGLKGNKLRRCRAIAKCKKLKGKKRKRCLAKARKIGVKKKTQPPAAAPKPPPPPPGGPPVYPPANRAPVWPNPLQSQSSTQFQYDPVTGFLVGATTTINVLSPASDPDGDPLTYTWTSSNGSIAGSGLSATWTRVISFGQPSSGSAFVTATDGKGGTARFEFRFL